MSLAEACSSKADLLRGEHADRFIVHELLHQFTQIRALEPRGNLCGARISVDGGSSIGGTRAPSLFMLYVQTKPVYFRPYGVARRQGEMPPPPYLPEQLSSW